MLKEIWQKHNRLLFNTIKFEINLSSKKTLPDQQLHFKKIC